MYRKKIILPGLLLSVATVAQCSLLLSRIPREVKDLPVVHAASASSGTYYASGAHLFDADGKPIVLIGANIESSFIYIKGWQSGKNPLTPYADPTFQVMSQDWHMNTLRLSISRAIYDLDKTTYLSNVTQVVQNANAHGLFVILNLHDDKKSGSLFPSATPTDLDLPFWKDVVAQFKDDPMVGYDLFNEPEWVHAGAKPDWNEWLNGGAQVTDSNGATAQEIGYSQLISTVRALSPTQLIIIEPGNASGSGASSEGGWSTLPAADILPSSNLIYSEHEYSGVAQGASIQNQKWGPLLGTYPIFYGEWAVLPNSYTAAQCSGMTPQNADQIANSFMAYAQSVGAGWTAWAFDIPHMIADTTNFTPTQMGPTTSWTCPASPTAPTGMGQDVKTFLTATQPTQPDNQPSPGNSPPPVAPSPSSPGSSPRTTSSGTQPSSTSSSSSGTHTSSSGSGNSSSSEGRSKSSSAGVSQQGTASTVGNSMTNTAFSDFVFHAVPAVIIGTIIVAASTIAGLILSYISVSDPHRIHMKEVQALWRSFLLGLRKLKSK